MNQLVRVVVLWMAVGLAGQALAQGATNQKTPGGLSFRHVQLPDDPQQALTFAWRDGTPIAVPGKEAVAVLGTALMMDGVKGLNASAMQEQLKDLHAAMGLSASANYTQGYLTAPKGRFAQAARMLVRVLTEPALVEERLVLLARNRIAASRQAGENAEVLAQRLLARRLFGDTPHYRLIAGDPAAFERIKVADIEAWRRDILVRAGLMIATAGPMDAEQAGREIDAIFGALPESGNVPAGAGAPAVRSPGRLIVIERPVVQTAIAVGGPTTLAVTPEVLLRAELGVSAFGGGSQGRLFKAVRERLGAAYGINAGLAVWDTRIRGFVIRTVVANAKAKEALTAIRDEYARFLADGVTEAEIEPLKTVLMTRNAERLRRAPSHAGALLSAMLVGYADDFFDTFDARLRAIDRAAVNAEVAANLPQPPLTAVVVAPSAVGLEADCVIKSPDEIARCE